MEFNKDEKAIMKTEEEKYLPIEDKDFLMSKYQEILI